ncbi:MAG: GGDEF domain-containing protein [Chloroflexi bacterium]|nr:GGDEF domain-containing protein [Chloroflexota bacterium]
MAASPKSSSVDPTMVEEHYLRDLKLSRLTRVAALVVTGMFFAWTIPYLPSGLDPDTYTGPGSLALMFSVLAVGLAALSIAYLLRASRRREMLVAWSALFDESTGLHNRQYFLDRLDLEIARATVGDRSFRVFLLQAARQDPGGQPQRLSREDLSAVAAALREQLSPYDTLASLRPDELAILAPGVVPLVFENTEQQLHAALRGALNQGHSGHAWKIRIAGNAVSGDISDPVRLIDETRAILQDVTPFFLAGDEPEMDHRSHDAA